MTDIDAGHRCRQRQDRFLQGMGDVAFDLIKPRVLDRQGDSGGGLDGKIELRLAESRRF